MKLLLGVHDVAYTDADGSTTTGKVAELLEEKYHVMHTFLELHETQIGDDLADEFSGAIEALAQGSRPDLDAAIPMGKIDMAFRNFLDSKEWENTSGQVIEAARAGVSHRFKSIAGKSLSAKSIAAGKVKAKGMVLKRRSRGPRPAFIDSGLYQASFSAWVES